MLDTHTFLMELYVMVDDFCQQAPKAEIRPSPVPSLSRSEVVTLGLFSQWQRFRSERDFYLEQLGCHWFMPNEHWTVIPKRQDIAVKIDRLVAPVFKLRDFFGTGGFGAAAPYDPKYDREGRLQFRIRTED